MALEIWQPVQFLELLAAMDDLIGGGATGVGGDFSDNCLDSRLNNTRDINSTEAALVLEAPCMAPAAASSISDFCDLISISNDKGHSTQLDMFWRAQHTKPDPKPMRVMPIFLWGV